MKPQPKLLGEVIPASALRKDLTGHAVRIYRYLTGRKLPAPRLLLVDGSPIIASRLAAMDLLSGYNRGSVVLPRESARPVLPKAPRRTTAKRAAKPLDNPTPDDLFASIFTAELAKAERAAKARARMAHRKLPAIEKLLPEAPTVVIRDKGAAYRADLEGIIARGEVAVRRFATNKHPGLPRKGAGVMPGHLNPVTIDRVDPAVLLTPEEA